MDLDKYITKNESLRKRMNQGIPAREKYCLSCGKPIENRDHLYYQSFCCIECKRKYVERDVDY